MSDERLKISVSFNPTRGYFTTGSELPQSLTALSLGGLRRRIEVALVGLVGPRPRPAGRHPGRQPPRARRRVTRR
jgi:hypothetical protein